MILLHTQFEYEINARDIKGSNLVHPLQNNIDENCSSEDIVRWMKLSLRLPTESAKIQIGFFQKVSMRKLIWCELTIWILYIIIISIIIELVFPNML